MQRQSRASRTRGGAQERPRIKEEKPDFRPQPPKRSSSGSSGGSWSPVPRKRSPGDRRGARRPEAPLRREPQDHARRQHKERRHRDRSEGDEHKRKKDGHRDRRREASDRGRAHDERNMRPRAEPGVSGRDRESLQLNEQQAEREYQNERRRQNRQNLQTLSNENPESDSRDSQVNGGESTQPKEEPSFELSGALAEDANTFRGVVIKYSEPPESRIPKKRWRLYPFKNDEPLPVMHIHRQSAYLLGRQRRIVDIPIDHPSCSKQHAVLQYRLVGYTRNDGTAGRRVRPYIIDLGSANGTYLNNQRIEAQRYYELREKDVLKFGFSSREYVILHEFSDTAEVDAKQEQDEDEDEEVDD
ncbi:smad nuclear-interacting protein 1 [Callorhinchus milii]|uniref:Smad nuclear interacting protein 1 n=1 Tax=Callorhinchus milii TaxID=7868 RepID=V9KLM7_CALMI|nr:smad nuclear-interacting protein 1 [Callorhinchus milii]|eukprot:gi/632976694/ref/XP_007904939.1/ PREDICTED: smad nuclear-interacting protein 1 [Callorhinchus milii]